MSKYKEHIINSEEIFRGKILNLKVDTVELPNKSYSKREIVEHPGAVGIVSINENGNILFVEQFRLAANQSLIEIPAGKIDAGEEPIEAAAREFKEETGYKAKELEHILSFYPSAGFCTEIIHIFKAVELEFVGQDLDDNEYLDVIELSYEEAKNMIANGQIIDGKTIIAIQSLMECSD